MSSGTGAVEQKQDLHHQEVEDFNGSREKDVGFHKSDDFVDPNILNDAYQGENREHEMGSWEAAKKHPMACMWAFIFCFTIVSYHQCGYILHYLQSTPQADRPSPPPTHRSWSLSTCS